MMETNLNSLRETLCTAMCTNVVVRERPDGRIYVGTPFKFADGDSFSIYLERLSSGGYRITDLGSTMMHLSYEQDVDKLRDGTRGKVFRQILTEMGLDDDDGEFRMEVAAERLGQGIFEFGQGLTRIHDLTMLNRVQVESTFMDDLKHQLGEIVGAGRIVEDYTAPGIEKADAYPADFAIIDIARPLLVFGVSSQAKARLATIVMQHLQSHAFSFRGMVVYADMETIPRADISRLTAVADEQVPSLSEGEALIRKVRQAVASA